MEENKKIKLLTISDHPLVASGVGIQTRHVIEGLLKTGKFQVRSLGAAIKHQNYQPQKVQEYGDDWIIYPIDGYGNEDFLRQVLDVEKPDALFFVTDPRFYGYLFAMSDEIRDRGIPMLYWHVWDELPVPAFNKPYYDSCDFVGCISKLTHHIVTSLGHPNCEYIPHAVDANIFKPLSKEERLKNKEMALGPNKDKFVYFYNSRNARRKQTSDVVRFFKETLDVVGQDKAFLLMHCDPHDPEGANLLDVCAMLGLRPDQIAFSNKPVPAEQMAIFYNIADCTVCLSNAEGFGLSSLESLMCGTPVISIQTGGLTDQNFDKETGKEYGVSIVPKTNSYTGSQQIPYIRECRCTDEDIRTAYLKMFNISTEDKEQLSKECSEHARVLFNLDKMVDQWYNAIIRSVNKMKQGYENRIKITKI